jgi:hypothetical protein
MRKEAVLDALISATIKTVEELEALVSMIDSASSEEGTTASKLRAIANLLDRLPLAANDLMVIKRRLRGALSSDPDKTPRAISVKDMEAVVASEKATPPEGTRFTPVEDQARGLNRRTETRPGIGIPLPKKDRE